MNKEIEIPEGYEARIEGNKVVLIQKESEDEKIRKSIIRLVQVGGYMKLEDRAKAIAYLEAHKESAWTEEDESFVTHILPRILNPDPWTLDQRSADKNLLTAFIEKQKRKFPAKWDEADEGMLNCIIATLCEESHGGREANDKMVAWLENRLKILRPQPQTVTVYKTASSII